MTEQELPDRREEKRVDVPQNETPAPTEDAQADSSPTQTETVQETHTETVEKPAE